MDTLPFYIFLFIHIVSLITGFGSVIVIDTFGLLWLLKFKKVTLERVNSVAEITQRLIWLGWCGLVCSGIFLITIKGYIDNLTKIKLFFVILVGLNGIFLHYIKKNSIEFASANKLPSRMMFRVFLATFISQLGWWGAFSIGFVHRHWRHNIPWPEHYVWVMFGILLLIATMAIVGESVTKKK